MPVFSKDAFVEGFITETGEHLDAINTGIISLKNDPKNKDTLAGILRDLHTIKGTSRMLGFPVIEQVSHGLEDVFKGIREEKYELSDHIVQLTFATSDCIQRALELIKAQGNDTMDVTAFTETYKTASQGLFFSVDPLIELNKGVSENEEGAEEGSVFGSDESLEKITSIRIDISRINEVIRSIDSLIIRQFRLKHQIEEFEKKLNEEGGKNIREVPKQLKEDLALAESAVFDAQHQILDLRMLPLNIVLTPLRKEIESEALQLQKNVHFDIPDTDFMLDKVVLEQLRDILLHLVRNSLDHGIETAEARAASGKKEQGTISIHTQQVSNYIKIIVSDDGTGIDYEKVREKAMRLYPNQQKEISSMGEKELQQYLFMSGFSTRDQANAMSGRGVGLDVVRISMEKIKGKIHLYSQKGKGTTFELTIPLSLATQQGLFIHAGGMKFMVPSHYIREIVDIESSTLTVMQGQLFLGLHGQLIPAYYLSSILGNDHTDQATSIIVAEYLETQMAIVVDSIEQYENVVVTPLPVLMRGMNALQGVVYDENYAIIPILNIPDTMQKLKGLLSYEIKKYRTKNEKKVYTILIVDDSATTRQIEQTIFESSGYIVETAVDGIDAIEKLKAKHIDAIITDISMPRMDGTILLSNIRRMEEYAGTPVIVVSGAYDPEAKQQFIEAGAQAFIVKSEFQRGNLLQAVKELLGEY